MHGGLARPNRVWHVDLRNFLGRSWPSIDHKGASRNCGLWVLSIQPGCMWQLTLGSLQGVLGQRASMCATVCGHHHALWYGCNMHARKPTSLERAIAELHVMCSTKKNRQGRCLAAVVASRYCAALLVCIQLCVSSIINALRHRDSSTY